MRVLIAEDDPVSRRLLQAALVKWGSEVIVTANGKEAWDALQAPDAPSLLVLDWLMPEMDGVEVCREARKTPALKSAYIILLTSRGSKEDIVEGLEAGADDYVTKPFDHGELRARGLVIRAGKKLIVTTAEVVHLDADGKESPCALMQQTIAVVQQRY